MKIKERLSEEHKRKIGLANSISLKGKHCSPKTEFKKGNISWNKGKEIPEKQMEKAKNWKGGIAYHIQRKICKNGGKDMTQCQICKRKTKIIIHHHNGNRYDNRLHNLGVICNFCHNAIHDNPNKRATRFHIGHLKNQHGGLLN